MYIARCGFLCSRRELEIIFSCINTKISYIVQVVEKWYHVLLALVGIVYQSPFLFFSEKKTLTNKIKWSFSFPIDHTSEEDFRTDQPKHGKKKQRMS